jgi:hypothetical protein
VSASRTRPGEPACRAALGFPGRLAVAGLIAALAACGEARHEPVRVIAQPRAVAPVEPAPVSAPVQAQVPVPADAPRVAPPPPVLAASVPVKPPRGLDAAPPPGLAGISPPQRRWQAGEPNGNAGFRAALEARQRTGGETAAP